MQCLTVQALMLSRSSIMAGSLKLTMAYDDRRPSRPAYHLDRLPYAAAPAGVDVRRGTRDPHQLVRVAVPRDLHRADRRRPRAVPAVAQAAPRASAARAHVPQCEGSDGAG